MGGPPAVQEPLGKKRLARWGQAGTLASAFDRRTGRYAAACREPREEEGMRWRRCPGFVRWPASMGRDVVSGQARGTYVRDKWP
ncbi:hypothetical protein DESPIG_00352 [Desulfovibrio piger ATCC 29098]|uniref:Uncharacterized protein n=1 Tax=Desulfovibrio piger ATCC 29098 TaxID=411464 RepID=B6WQM8_9BACT|nr:hypothetical protein DESPIG_00352 [Desulfovibrio piger ATCC 29098]